MRVHAIALLAIPALISMLMPGCLQSLTANSGGYAKNYSGGLHNITLYDPNTMEQCKLGQCICMACRNTSSWFGFRTSFAGGNCLFIQGCTQDKFNDLINSSLTVDKFPRQFMIGQGYSLSDFGEANGWCGDRLDIAVQWLVGSNETNYTMPDAGRARCFLSYDVMPVYVLYSKSQSINVPLTRKIADALKSAGPLVITTEMDLNTSVPGAVKNVSDQVSQIDAACGNKRTGGPDEAIHCFVALGVRVGDYDAVNQVRQQLGPDGWKKVDLIAFGINAHTMDLNWTNEDSCNPDAALQQALAFARFSLYNNSKPTIIPYIMFDSSGPDASGRCNWTEDGMVNGYGDVFKYWLFPFQKAGVIGMAAYAFNISQFGFVSDPLGCKDCSLGANDKRMAAWFASCRNYKIEAAKYPVGDNMIVFPNESGGTCDYNLNAMGMLQGQYTDQAEQITPDLTAPNSTLVRCDACVNENSTFPFDVKVASIGLSIPDKNATYCRSVPALDYYAGKRNLDPMLVRAIVLAESKFDNCSAAQVSSSGGVDSGCYPAGYDYVPDPEGNCPNTGSKIPGKRYCGLGLMQTLEPPYTFWPSSLTPDGKPGQYYSGAPSDQLFLEAQLGGRSGLITDSKTQCTPNFDPFNATDSACMGTYKFMLNMNDAANMVNKNLANLGNPDSNTQRGITYYLALHYYRGYGGYAQGWITEFGNRYKYDKDFCDQDANQNDPMCLERGTDSACTAGTADCCYGMKDFVKFVRECRFAKGTPPTTLQGDASAFYGDYGSKVLSYYRALVDGCGDAAGCPSWKTLQSAACTNTPKLGTPEDSAKAGDKCIMKTS